MQPEIQTEYILPHNALQPYVKYIGIRIFDTLGAEFPRAIHAESEILLNFFFHCRLSGFTTDKKEMTTYCFNEKNDTQCYYTGIQTSTKGTPVCKGATTIITLHLKPVGFYYIFGVSPKEIVNKHGETADVFSREIEQLYEQIENTSMVHEAVAILERYLLKKLLSPKLTYKNPGISAASNLLIKSKGIYSIKKLAADCNMTQQTLKVNFIDQVGVAPKEFCRLLRFNHAIKMKLYHSGLTWTNIAHACGFFDQMHLIKDFKKFTSLSPKKFIEIINPPLENFKPIHSINKVVGLLYAFSAACI